MAQMQKVKAAEDKERASGAPAPLRLEAGYGTRPELGIGNDFLLAAPLDVFGKADAERAAAHAETMAARAELSQASLDLQTQVFTAYAELLSAQSMEESARELLDLAKKSYESTRQRIQAGDLAPNQLLRADLDLRTTQQLVNTRTHTLESARLKFAAALQVPVESVGELSADLPAAPRGETILSRPDIASAKAVIDSASAGHRVALTQASPDLELQFAHDYWDSSGRFTARAQLVWNFFDYGAARNSASSSFHAKVSAQQALQDLTTQAAAELQAARVEFAGASQEAGEYTQLIQDAKSLLEKEQQAFASGAGSLLEVIDAARALRDVEDGESEARTHEIEAEAKLLAASGSVIVSLPVRSTP